MKQYLTYKVPDVVDPQPFFTFDSVDGTMLRIAWDKVTTWGPLTAPWGKIDETTPILGAAARRFYLDSAKMLSARAREQEWDNVTFYLVAGGPNTVNGIHYNDDKMFVTLQDVHVASIGFLHPEIFVELFASEVETPAYFGHYLWDQTFVDHIYEAALPGISFEGVVGRRIYRAGKTRRRDVEAVKTRTSMWHEAVLDMCLKSVTTSWRPKNPQEYKHPNTCFLFDTNPNVASNQMP